jgi:DNA-binding CsgD family transcriptional regulator
LECAVRQLSAEAGAVTTTRLANLTLRERQVLDALAAGHSRTEAAAQLRMSRHTVRTHVQHVLAKLEVHSILEAVTLALRNAEVTRPRTGGNPVEVASAEAS